VIAAAVHPHVAVGPQPAITQRTDWPLMLRLRAIVAADGQQRVPSSREYASASAGRTRRSLPEAGEFAHTQLMTAMLVLPASGLSDFGSGMRAASDGRATPASAAIVTASCGVSRIGCLSLRPTSRLLGVAMLGT
jgi:hypothetical protein